MLHWMSIVMVSLLALAALKSCLPWSCNGARVEAKNQKERLVSERLHAKLMSQGVDMGGGRENITSDYSKKEGAIITEAEL